MLETGEIRYDIERLPVHGAKRPALLDWYNRLLCIMSGRILSINTRVAEEWAKLQAETHSKGLVLPLVESLLAAPARRYHLTMATDKVTHFEPAGVRLFNPLA